MRKTNDIFEKRLAKHMDELRWLYMELYDNEAMSVSYTHLTLPTIA